MPAKRSHSDTVITYNVEGRSLERIDMGVEVPNDYEKLRDLKRPRLTTYYGDEADLDEFEKNLCLSCIVL